MNEQNYLTEQEKLAVAAKLLAFLKAEIPQEKYDNSALEVLMLAYHASTSTHYMRTLIGAV